MKSVRLVLFGSVLIAGVLLLAPAASAQAVGVRAGVSADPEQFYFGAHYETTPIIPHLRFRPNAEIGIGHDLTVVTGNLEFAYYVPIPRQPWDVYLGGGPAIVFARASGGGSDTGGGFNLLAGVAHRGGLFVELKIGLADSPELKFGVGYTFK